MKHVLGVKQLDGKAECFKPFTGLFPDPAPGSLRIDTVDLDEGETRLPVVRLPDQVEVEVGVFRLERLLHTPQMSRDTQSYELRPILHERMHQIDRF